MLTCEPHPLLEPRAFVARFPGPMEEWNSDSLMDWFDPGSSPPVVFDESVKPKVRQLLRHGSYKPTGRGKPASEYLRQAVTNDKLSTINLVVDACNVVSYHSGLPISVVDLDLLQRPLTIAIAGPDSQYVFNASGQTIKLDDLLCLFDAAGPCANAVKDSQRTKTSNKTVNSLSVVWGSRELSARTEAATRWYEELLRRKGVDIERLEIQRK